MCLDKDELSVAVCIFCSPFSNIYSKLCVKVLVFYLDYTFI